MKKKIVQVRNIKVSIEDLKAFLKKRNDVSAAYLFGSAANEEKVVNDLDILVLLSRNVDKNEIYMPIPDTISRDYHRDDDPGKFLKRYKTKLKVPVGGMTQAMGMTWLDLKRVELLLQGKVLETPFKIYKDKSVSFIRIYDFEERLLEEMLERIAFINAAISDSERSILYTSQIFLIIH